MSTLANRWSGGSWAFLVATSLAACGGKTLLTGAPSSSDAGASSLTCGPGTYQSGTECLGQSPNGNGPNGNGGGGNDLDASSEDTGDAGQPTTSPDETDEATSFGVDPAHDNARPDVSIASPLTPTWAASFSGAVSYPLITDGEVVVAAAESQPNVRALDLATGHVVWGPVAFGAIGFGPPQPMITADAGRLFVLGSSGQVTALDVATGARLWTTQLTGESDFWSPPVAQGGFVYVNGLEDGGITYGIDAASGKVVWMKNTFDGSDGAPAVANGVVYDAEACDQLYAFDARTGTQSWMHSTSCTGGGGAAPSVYENRIWERDWALGAVIIDATGHDVGTFVSDVVPAFHGGVAFYVHGTTLSAVDVSSSTIKWTFTGDGALCTSPLVAGGGAQVFIGSRAGNVYELDEATGAQISVNDPGGVTCSDETNGMALGSDHLVVPIGNDIVVY